LAALIVLASLAMASWRVVRLETNEIEHIAAPQVLGTTLVDEGASEPSLELARVELREGMLATFEFCARDSLSPERWGGAIDLDVQSSDGRHVVADMPLVESVLAYATRTGSVACLLLAFDAEIPRDGEYVVRASWNGRTLPDELTQVPVSVRVLALSPLTAVDRVLVVLVMIGALLCVLGAVRWRRAWGDVTDDMERREQRADTLSSSVGRRELTRVLVGVFALVVVATILGFVPLPGAIGGLARGVGVALAQVAIALVLVGGSLPELAVVRPTRAFWALWLTPFVGIVLWYGGDLLSGLVPSTGEAPIQTFVSSPSGMLTVAVVAAAVPLAEELFFRGLVFGAVARRSGEPIAFFVTVVLFTLAHLSQVWGAWGSVCAILVTAVVLTGLRWWTGTVVVPALAHLVHNGLIVYFTVSASSSG